MEPDEDNTTENVNTDIENVSIQDVSDTLWSTGLDMVRDFIDHVPFLLAAVIVLILTWAIASAVTGLGGKLLGSWHKRESLKELILRLTSILIWVFGLLLTAIVVFPGLTPTRALSGLGLVSIAVGLAFKDIFENFFAGILILWRFPLERGDFIECEGIVGKVEKVWVRMSYIRKTSGELVVVPNSFLFKNPVKILTDMEVRRVTITVGVAYHEDLATAVQLVESTVKGCDSIVKDKPVQVFANNFGSSSMDMEVTWWCGAKPVDVRRSRAEIVVAVKSALDEAGIEIPFPYRTLTFSQPLETRGVEQQS